MTPRPRTQTISPSHPFRKSGTKATTLVEVVVALLIISLFAASALPVLHQQQKRTLANYYQLEAYRLAQSIAEYAMQVNFPTNFTDTFLRTDATDASATQWRWTATEPAQLRYLPGRSSSAALTYPGGGSVIFRKTLSSPVVVGEARRINITIAWTFARRDYSITVPVIRGGN